MAKVNIISGFLGAGKTTLIKKLLDGAFEGEKVVLLENEYGEVGIDGGFMKDKGIQITELNSGCICCTLVGDFTQALGELIDTYHPDRVLIEPTSATVAQPASWTSWVFATSATTRRMSDSLPTPEGSISTRSG